MLLLIMLISAVVPFGEVETYLGANSYINAKEFYESTALNGESYHAEMINGTIYYATSAKLASSSTNLKYHTVGFDITLSGNGHSVSFTVQRTGGSMEEVDCRKDSTHEYILYAVRDSRLYELASKSNPTEASYVLSASVINVQMNAILVTKQGTSLGGGIVENGAGGFYQSDTIYRLKNSSDLNILKRVFAGHDFKSYINITEWLDNNQLQIRYQVQGLNSTSSSTATVGNGYSVADGFLCQNGSTYNQVQRVLQQTRLLSPNTINLSKAGWEKCKDLKSLMEEHWEDLSAPEQEEISLCFAEELTEEQIRMIMIKPLLEMENWNSLKDASNLQCYMQHFFYMMNLLFG